MKLTKNQLRRLIKEELESAYNEGIDTGKTGDVSFSGVDWPDEDSGETGIGQGSRSLSGDDAVYVKTVRTLNRLIPAWIAELGENLPLENESAISVELKKALVNHLLGPQ